MVLDGIMNNSSSLAVCSLRDNRCIGSDENGGTVQWDHNEVKVVDFICSCCEKTHTQQKAPDEHVHVSSYMKGSASLFLRSSQDQPGSSLVQLPDSLWVKRPAVKINGYRLYDLFYCSIWVSYIKLLQLNTLVINWLGQLLCWIVMKSQTCTSYLAS